MNLKMKTSKIQMTLDLRLWSLLTPKYLKNTIISYFDFWPKIP